MRFITVILFILTFFISAHIVRAQECHSREVVISAMTAAAVRLEASINNVVYRGEVAKKVKDTVREFLKIEEDFEVTELIVFNLNKMGVGLSVPVWFGPDGCGRALFDHVPTEIMNDILMKSGGRSARTE